MAFKYSWPLPPLTQGPADKHALISIFKSFANSGNILQVLAMMPQKNNVSWTVIITCLAKHAHHDQALALFAQMVSHNFTPNEVIFVCVVNTCTSQKALRDGYTDHGFGEEAMILFQRMQYEGLKPDQVTLMSILKACTFLQDLDRGKRCHVIIINADFKQTIPLDNALINMYAKCGRLDISKQIFQRMEKRDVASWSMIIAGCIENGQSKIALEYFELMQDATVKPNYVTLISVLKACANLVSLKEGKFIHNSIIIDAFCVELNAVSALIDMYTKCGQLGDAYRVFHNSAKKDVVLWTAMISGYAQQGLNEEALELFGRMLTSSIEANIVTFVSVLCACTGLAAIKQGTYIHEQICKSGLDANVDVCASLINMYSKCGLLEDARRIFDMMPACSIILWTTMVTAYAQHGHGKEALKLVNEMQKKNMKLDHVSFVSVIAACNNEGLVHEASHLIDLMCKDDTFVPSTKHYTCMADALGRAGQLKEAEIMLKSMPFQPNAISWRSFLGAWKNREGVKLVDNMAEHVIDFEPQNADDFVLLSNVYCAAAASEDQGKTPS